MANGKSVEVGAAAPDFSGVDTEGRPVRLSQYWSRGPAVVVFLRHLGCTFCRQHVLQLRQEYAQMRKSGVEVVCVAMGSDKVGKAFRILFELPFPMLMIGETETSAYRAYGLERGRASQLLGLQVLASGFAAMRQLGSRFAGRLSGDGLQLAGTFVVDQSGTIRMVYRSRHAGDNPPSRLLHDALSQLPQGGVQVEDNHASAPSALAR